MMPGAGSTIDPVGRRWAAGGTLPCKQMDLLGFQKKFIKEATRPGIDTAALSVPRGNGKSFLAALIAAQALPTLPSGYEIALAAASIEQGRIVFRFIRQMLGERGYRYLDSSTRCSISTASGARLRVVGSNGRTAMGLVNTPLVIADEPGAWEVNGGQLLHDAIQTAQGKPGSPLRVVYIGTLAPSTSGWWHDLIDGGTQGRVYVQVLQGDLEKWDRWSEVSRVNPLWRVDSNFRLKLLEERELARKDTRLKARFLSYRLNLPTQDESEMVLTPDDYRAMIARPVPDRIGSPIVSVDMGGGRAWSAAVAIWQTGRVEALAVAPGIPDLSTQEKRDRVSAGTYRRLVESGQLHVAESLRVQPPARLWQAITSTWGLPVRIICDRFRLGELQDVVEGATTIEPRVSRWSEAGFDIRALRRLAADGPMGISEDSRAVLATSLSVSQVKNDDQGNTRIAKKGSNNTARDDVAAALVLAAGAFMRSQVRAGGLVAVGEPI